MNSVENFGLDQLSNQAKFSFKSRDAPVSVSMQSSHNASDGDGENIIVIVYLCIYNYINVHLFQIVTCHNTSQFVGIPTS